MILYPKLNSTRDPSQYPLNLPSLVRFNITPFKAVKRSLKKITMYPKRLNDKSPNAATSAPCFVTILNCNANNVRDFITG